MSKKVYTGERTEDGCVVLICTPKGRTPLPLWLDLFNHSPTGFEWGYQGSGPAQLALALLADVVGDKMAVAWHQRYKRCVVAGLEMAGWAILPEEIEEWVASQQGALGDDYP